MCDFLNHHDDSQSHLILSYRCFRWPSMLLELLSLRLLPHIRCSGSCSRRHMRSLCSPQSASTCHSVNWFLLMCDLVFRNTMDHGTCTPANHTRAYSYAFPGLLAGRAAQTCQHVSARLPHCSPAGLGATRGGWVGREEDLKGKGLEGKNGYGDGQLR